MSKIKEIQILVQEGFYYLTEHAFNEAFDDDLDIYDMENAIVTGKIRRSWPKEGKYEVIGLSLDERMIGLVCRITLSHKVRIITVYEDKPKK